MVDEIALRRWKHDMQRAVTKAAADAVSDALNFDSVDLLKALIAEALREALPAALAAALATERAMDQR